MTSLSLAHDDMVTVEGVESLVGLRALVTLDISGCKVKTRSLEPGADVVVVIVVAAAVVAAGAAVTAAATPAAGCSCSCPVCTILILACLGPP